MLRKMAPERIYESLTAGAMREQARLANLTDSDMRRISPLGWAAESCSFSGYRRCGQDAQSLFQQSSTDSRRSDFPSRLERLE